MFFILKNEYVIKSFDAVTSFVPKTENEDSKFRILLWLVTSKITGYKIPKGYKVAYIEYSLENFTLVII